MIIIYLFASPIHILKVALHYLLTNSNLFSFNLSFLVYRGVEGRLINIGEVTHLVPEAVIFYSSLIHRDDGCSRTLIVIEDSHGQKSLRVDLATSFILGYRHLGYAIHLCAVWCDFIAHMIV